MNTIKKFIHYYGPYKTVFFIDLICAAVISLIDLEIYFQENPDRESDKYQEIQKYLKLRIRSVMELLIENEDTERMEQIEKCGWFSANELENFIRCAQEKAKLRSLVWLLHLKDKKYGYPKKDFSL